MVCIGVAKIHQRGIDGVNRFAASLMPGKYVHLAHFVTHLYGNSGGKHRPDLAGNIGHGKTEDIRDIGHSEGHNVFWMGYLGIPAQRIG